MADGWACQGANATATKVLAAEHYNQNAVSLAWFAYNAAMMNGKFPR